MQAHVTYFGKIPSRGDFVKATNSHQLVSTLDQWLMQAMELMSVDPRWKITYDAVRPINFAFLGSNSRLAIAGHLVASRDASQRRFPFLAASPLSVEQPLNFISRSPLVLSRLWTRLENLTRGVMAERDSSSALQTLAGTVIPIEVSPAAYNAKFLDFSEMQTVGELEAMLHQSGHSLSLRRSIVALGLLLAPVMTAGTSRLEKGLKLSLPTDPLYRYLVATFWLDLIAPFLARGDFELAAFIGVIGGAPALVLGFDGTVARSLQSVFDPQVDAEQNIRIDDAEWVEDHIGSDYGVKKLASYLEQPGLSLRQARDTFRETFIGA